LAWRLGKLNDLRNKYLVKYLNDQVNGVLYPTLHQLRTDDGGTISGRFSCVRPNLQQVMGKDKHKKAYGWLTEYGETDYLIKRLFVPGTNRLLSTDGKQMEYRILAHYTGSKRLQQAYAEDPETNFHHYVRDEMLVKAKPDISHTEVKVTNFTIAFGGKNGSVSRNLGITLEAADEILLAYERQFPEVMDLIQKASDRAGAVGYVRSLLGRRCRFPDKQRLHKALNGVIQPSAADIVKLKMIRLYEERRRLGLTLRMMVHDQFVSDAQDEAMPEIEKTMAIEEIPLTIPILWDSHLGANWAEAG
jgi:DNA polymerase-1